MMSKTINRREFLTDSALSGAGILLGKNLSGCSSAGESGISSFDIMKEVRKFRKIDSNAHINPSTGDAESLINNADMLGIEKMFISVPTETGSLPPQMFKENNDKVIRAVKKYPDRLTGKVTINPFFQKESLEEINRCVNEGLVGLKVFTQVKINDPLFYPVIEKFIDLKMIIQMHGECQLGVGGYRMKYDINERPNASIPEDFADIAGRYPEGMFQFAHIGGGGDVEYSCKIIKDHPNIFVDISGSNNEDRLVDFCLEYLGEDRVLFGTDGSYYQAVSSILSSGATESQKKKIFFDNFFNILKTSGYDFT
jgi:predicted TIM-barrel fold metal-dependent hydrolase